MVWSGCSDASPGSASSRSGEFDSVTVRIVPQFTAPGWTATSYNTPLVDGNENRSPHRAPRPCRSALRRPSHVCSLSRLHDAADAQDE
jgi:hypothetical protein